MRPCTRELSEHKSSLERQILRIPPTQKNTNFHTHSTLDGVEVFCLCCDNWSPEGRDVQTGLSPLETYSFIYCMWCLVLGEILIPVLRPRHISHIWCCGAPRLEADDYRYGFVGPLRQAATVKVGTNGPVWSVTLALSLH
jgi:hypothetical protein